MGIVQHAGEQRGTRRTVGLLGSTAWIVLGAMVGTTVPNTVLAQSRQDRPAHIESESARHLPLQSSQFAQAEQPIEFDIPGQDLNSAILAFAEKAGMQVFYDIEKLRGLRTQGIQGSYTPEQALRILLAGTGLEYRFTGSDTVMLERAAVQSGEMLLQPVTVTATREGGALDTLSRNVTVIPREEIQKQQETSQGVADLLGKLVPGMAPSSQTLTNFGQTLRGRDVLVLIDGVPMNTNRNISRDLFNITPSNIESIEVVNGGSSVYAEQVLEFDFGFRQIGHELDSLVRRANGAFQLLSEAGLKIDMN